MKYKLRKPISLLLALCMLLACVPALSGPVSAEDAANAQSTVEHISVEPLALIEGVDGYNESYWDETAGEWFYYDIEPETVTIHYQDGSTFTGAPYEVYDEATGSVIEFTSDQSYENQWGVGTHTATATFMGVSVEYMVVISETPVERISVEPLTFMEGTHGLYNDYWDETTGETVWEAWFCYDVYPETVSIYYKDGSTFTGTPDEIYEKTGYYVDTNSDQSYENPWGVGTHIATATFMGVSAEFAVEISESPVESILVEPIALIEKVHGDYEDYWDETAGKYVKWFRYDSHPEMVTIHYKDGSTLTAMSYEIYEKTGNSFISHSNQSYENQWGVGTHTARATFMGVTTEYTVEISENPVESISVEPITLLEGFDGGNGGYWDETVGVWIEEDWFQYNIEPKSVIIHYKDGRTITGTPDEIYEQTGYRVDYNSDQSSGNLWGVGTHTATATFMGVSAEYTVEIAENPVESISVEPLTLIEGVDGGNAQYWDETTGEWVDEGWFEYYINPATVTIHYKNELDFTGTPDEIFEKTGYYVYFGSDQSIENPWGVGTHTATATFVGVTTEYTIVISEKPENPVESISVEPLTLTEGINGENVQCLDEATGEWVKWFCYDIEPKTVTIHYKDGRAITGTPDEIFEETGYYVYFGSDQSIENPWGVGIHTATARFMDVTTEYTVVIAEDPKKPESILIEPLSLIERTDGHRESRWDETTGEYVLEDTWFCYDIEPKTVTIHYKDGRAITGTPQEIYETTGSWIDFTSDQSYENPWGVGTHTASATFMGVTTEYTIVISETPVESISIEPLTMIEGTHGYYGYWDETAGKYVEWFYYDIEPETLTIHYKDGSVFTGTPYELSEAKGYSIEFDSDQSIENLWGVGTHTATATFMGVSTQYEIVITENPVEKIEIVKAPDTSAFLTGECIDLKGAVLRTYYKDGSYEDLTFEWPTVGRNMYYAFHNQRLNDHFAVTLSESSFAEPGTYKIELSYLNATCTYDVTVVDSMIESITIRCDSEDSLIITAKQSDGTSFDMNVLAMDVWDAGDMEGEHIESGFLLTDQGSFLAAFCYPKDGGFYIQTCMGPEGTILKSNSLDRCGWIDFNKRLEAYVGLVYSLSSTTAEYEGTVTESNIDDLIAMAIVFGTNSDTPLEYEVRNGQIVVQGAALKECLMQIFDLTEIDLSLSKNYNPQTGEYANDINGVGDGICLLPITVTRSNGVIKVQANMFDGENVRILLNEENNKMQAFYDDKSNAHEHDFVKGETVAPTEMEDGYTIYKCSHCGKTEKRDIVPATGKPAGPETPATGDRGIVLPALLLLASTMSLCILVFKRRSLGR